MKLFFSALVVFYCSSVILGASLHDDTGEAVHRFKRQADPAPATTDMAPSTADDATTTNADITTSSPTTTDIATTGTGAIVTTTLTLDTTKTTMTSPTSPPKGARDRDEVRAVVGGLTALLLLAMSVTMLVTVFVFFGCKVQKRRRHMKDLVERTKHDIFEGTGGVHNAACDSDVEDATMHNVLNTSPTGMEHALGFDLPSTIDNSVADSGAQLTVHAAMEDQEL